MRKDDFASSHNTIFTSFANREKDHDHSGSSPNPTVFFHSETDPDSDNTQWLSLSHDTTTGLIKSGKGNKKKKNPNFRKYTSIENVKNYPDVLKEKYIICSEKVHGTNYRAGYVKYSKFNIFKKIWKWLGYGSEYELVFGSHNIQLQGLLKKKTFYKKNVYLEMVGKYNLKEILKPNEVIYAEIYGDGIQKGYTYGCLQDEHKMVVVDVMIEGKYIDTEKAIQFCEERELPYVPVLYKGVFDMETFDKLMKGTSKLSMTQPIKEGLVITE